LLFGPLHIVWPPCVSYCCVLSRRCENTHNTTDCERRALQGECNSNPGFMIARCSRTCLGCAQKNPGTNTTEPGLVVRFKKSYSPYSITEHRVPELIPVLGSQPAGDVSHKPGGRLPLLSAKPAVTPTTHKRAATNFCCSVYRGTMGVNSLPKTVTRQPRGCDLSQALLRLSPAR